MNSLSEQDVEKVKNSIAILAQRYPFMEQLTLMEVSAFDTQYIATDNKSILISEKCLAASNQELNWALLFIGIVISKNLINPPDEMKSKYYPIAANYFINNIIANYNDPQITLPHDGAIDSTYANYTIGEIYEAVKNRKDFKFADEDREEDQKEV